VHDDHDEEFTELEMNDKNEKPEADKNYSETASYLNNNNNNNTTASSQPLPDNNNGQTALDQAAVDQSFIDMEEGK
jgi:hypothetical protein